MRDISTKIDKPIVDAILLLNDVSSSLGIQFLIVGARARDLFFSVLFDIPTIRATLDVDFAVRVKDWTEFEKLTGNMLLTHTVQAHRSIKHRFIHDNGVQVDIIPFGGIESPPGSLSWPPSQDIVMSTIGFEDAFRSSIKMQISSEPECVVNISTPAGLAIMKLVSWEQGYPSRSDDAKDLFFVMKNYIDAGNNERLYSTDADLAQERDFDFMLASPRLLGRDVAMIASSDTLDTVTRIVDSQIRGDSQFFLAQDMIRDQMIDDEKLELALTLLRQLRVGLSEKSVLMTTASSEERNMLFVSHAWEDSDFARWLSLQLAKSGYGVWCDVTKLLGGENWPEEINYALQKRTAKFLFVHSSISNQKENPLNELQLALNVSKSSKRENLIVPLRIENIPVDKFDFRLTNTQWVDFTDGWALGLARLLDVLKRDKVVPNPSSTPQSVGQWWATYGVDGSKTLKVPEKLESNRFRIESIPELIYFHFTGRDSISNTNLDFPLAPYNQYVASFCTAEELVLMKALQAPIQDTYAYNSIDFLNGRCNLIVDPKQANRMMVRLLNQSFEKYCRRQRLRHFQLSRGNALYFDKDTLPSGRIVFNNRNALNRNIKLWGKAGDRSWHLAIRALANSSPEWHFEISTHVLIRSSFGTKAASKSTTRYWRNLRWSNLLKAAIVHLAKEETQFNILSGIGQQLVLRATCELYENPVSYEEPREELSEGVVDESND